MSPLLRLFHMTHKGIPAEAGPVMCAMQGSAQARILMAVPPASAVDYEQGVPFSDELGVAFHSLILREYGFDLSKNVVAVAASGVGVKPRQASYALIRKFVQSVAARNLADKFISVGSLAFHHIFSDGRLSSPFVPGVILYPKILNCRGTYKPLFTFPEISPLLVNAPGGSREEWAQRQKRERLCHQLLAKRALFTHFLNLTTT
jgi:hypothetical protein